MKLTHKSEMVQKFADVMLRDYYKDAQKRSGLHRSDVIACPLRAYWRLTDKIKPIYSSQNVGTLLIGTLAHQVLHQNFDAQEKEFDLYGITVTVDAIFGVLSGAQEGKQFPIESKTTRKRIYRKEDILQDWIEQLAIAMAVMDVDKGYLMILNVISFSLTVWEVEMNEEERKTCIQGCVWQIGSILDAIQKRDPSLLSPKTSECENCPYRPMRTRPDGCIYYRPKKET